MTLPLPRTVEVLIAEDEPIDLELALRALRPTRLGTAVQVARDGQEAVDFLLGLGPHAWRRDEEPPRLVLLDVKLPKLNGFDVLSRLRANPATSLVPVVMLSSSQERVDVLRSYRLGANGYVVKPVEFERYLRAIRHLARYWLGINHPPEHCPPGARP